MSDTNKVIIIGSGPAGWTAAIYAARAHLSPIVFEGSLEPLGQLALTTEIENYPGFPPGKTKEYLSTALKRESGVPQWSNLPYWITSGKDQPTSGINGPELMELMRVQAWNFGTVILPEDVTRVDLKQYPFKVYTPQDEYEALSLIISTGAKAKYLGLPSEEKFKNRGVSACAVCDGALPRYENKPVVVVGGGDSAAEESLYLTKYASQVRMIVRRDVLRASKTMQSRVLNNKKIKIHWNSEIAEVIGDDENGVICVKLKDNSYISCSGMFCAIGHTPNTSFLDNQLELTDHGYIKLTVPFRTNTSVPGVFAAGDVADSYYRQAVTAAGTGCMAALDVEKFLTNQGE